MLWWNWVLLGLAFLALEMVMAGALIFLFFGLSALLVGALVGGVIWLNSWIVLGVGFLWYSRLPWAHLPSRSCEFQQRCIHLAYMRYSK